MRKALFLLAVTVLVVFPVFCQDVNYTKDYIDGMQKKSGPERLNAMKAYVKKYPDTSQKFTKLAYYWMAIDYLEVKDFAKAISTGLKVEKLGLGDVGAGEEARLYLVIGNAYAVKGDTYDKAKALKYINKAMASAKKANDKQVQTAAKGLKDKLSAPTGPKLTPLQKFKQDYSNENFSGAVTKWKDVPATDKNVYDNAILYAHVFFKQRKYDTALKEYEALLKEFKKPMPAYRMGEIYKKKAARNKALYDSAAKYYLAANLLYKKENEGGRAKAAFQYAEGMLGEKYGYNKKVKELERIIAKNKKIARKDVAEIKKKEKELRKLERQIRKAEAMDESAPPYVYDQVATLKKEIETLKSGGTSDEIEKLMDELAALKKKIQAELEALKKKVKTELGI